MKRQAFVPIFVLLTVMVTTVAHADPILKPRKYFGPIPQNSLSFRVGFLGGATSEEIIRFLDGGRTPQEEALSEDFGNGLAFDLAYMYKPHPQFAVRAAASVTFLRSTGSGFFVSGDAIFLPPDSTILAPVIDYTREFNVDLFTLEVSGVYFFNDAAVKDFQPYIGGGFSLGIPYARYEEQQQVRDTNISREIKTDDVSTAPGVHALLGAFYYITNRLAVTAETRVQLMESKYSFQTLNEDDVLEDVSFVVDYTGFYLMIGIARGF
jgi:hypothetical protein